LSAAHTAGQTLLLPPPFSPVATFLLYAAPPRRSNGPLFIWAEDLLVGPAVPKFSCWSWSARPRWGWPEHKETCQVSCEHVLPVYVCMLRKRKPTPVCHLNLLPLASRPPVASTRALARPSAPVAVPTPVSPTSLRFLLAFCCRRQHRLPPNLCGRDCF